ncbi:hypothetical protein HMPREF0973_00156 [Prevotella veroralis F0319]|uniref:Uncharacterized protein n=1 Tax=Prevotella veroralis F0319 TaxID=649761 RepID=C9MKN2_9BACT|nr:hypothetical protein HMPREF0973_00156 [Prevotella veroralis F0319]
MLFAFKLILYRNINNNILELKERLLCWQMVLSTPLFIRRGAGR